MGPAQESESSWVSHLTDFMTFCREHQAGFQVTAKAVAAGILSIAYEEHGGADGWPCILGHGFPYDVRAYAEVAAALAEAGARVIVPYLRGFGPTRFRSEATPRSGQQAAIGADVPALMDALEVSRAVLAGYDWGGRAACIAAALWPERVSGLVSCGNGYNIQNIPKATQPLPPEQEWRYWYQYYFHSERGRAGLTQNRRALCRLLWQQFSPTWRFDDATFERTAPSLDNPDFVEITVHSYRHRYGGIPGDPALDAIEARLAAQPAIAVPTIVLSGLDDGVEPQGAEDHAAQHFTSRYERRLIAGAGHNLPQEAPGAFAEAVLELS